MIVTAFGMMACSQRAEQSLSRDYQELKPFLSEVGIDRPKQVFFRTGPLQLPLPSLHCFTRNGKRIHLPPGCFANLDQVISRLELDLSGEPVDDQSPDLSRYLRKAALLNAWGQPARLLHGSNDRYLLIIEFISLKDPGLMQSLKHTLTTVCNKLPRTKIVFVHAFSRSNIRAFRPP